MQWNPVRRDPTEAESINGRVALIHDWFGVRGGGENVVSEILALSPNADVFTVFNLFSPAATREVVGDHALHVSRLNSLPLVRKYYRQLLLLAARAVEQFDLSAFDVVISSSSSVSKGVLCHPGQPHISYIHSPPRYAWDLSTEYMEAHKLSRGLKAMMAREVFHRFRQWDLHSAQRPDIIVANSEFVRGRIWKYYRRPSIVIHPPVDVERFSTPRRGAEHFVTASRLVDYKRVDLIVRAFNQRPDLKLVVVGEGPQLQALKSIAGPNVELPGRVSNAEMEDIYARARAFVFAAVEDFGISPLEAQAAGLPVIALGIGGSAETIIDSNANRSTGTGSGILYREQTVSGLLEGIARFEGEEDRISESACRSNARRFRREIFASKMVRLVNSAKDLAPPTCPLPGELQRDARSPLSP